MTKITIKFLVSLVLVTLMASVNASALAFKCILDFNKCPKDRPIMTFCYKWCAANEQCTDSVSQSISTGQNEYCHFKPESCSDGKLDCVDPNYPTIHVCREIPEQGWEPCRPQAG